MRTKIHAYVQFGMLYVPVGVASAASRKDLKLRQLHVDCSQPIKQAQRCAVCDVVLSSDDIVKGYEVAKDNFVIVDEAELAQFAAPRKRVIDIKKFVPREEITPGLIDKTDWLAPNATINKPYELLVMALDKAGFAGLGRSSLYGKEHPVAVVTHGGALMLHTLFGADELVDGSEIRAMLTYESPGEELDLAIEFIRLTAGSLEQNDLVNDGKQRALLYIEAKAQGTQFEAKEEAEPIEPMDYKAILRELVEKARA